MPTEYKSDDFSLGQLLSTTSPPIRVPEWQRNYSWTTNQIETFWTDLTSFEEKFPGEGVRGHSYFLGSIVLVNDGTSHLLLDGQQRLATATILLSVVRDFLRRYDANAATRTQARYIADYDDAQRITEYKLTLNRFDKEFFRAEVQDREDPKLPAVEYESHRLIRNARTFFTRVFEDKYSKLGGGEPSFEWAIRIQGVLTNHMTVVGIQSDDEDRAAEVFETLNDRGIGLSAPDLLRNLLLRRCPNPNQEAVIECWKDVLEVGEEGRVETFLRHFWLSRHGDVKTRTLYREIKSHLLDNNVDSLEFSRELQRDATVYRDLLGYNHNDEEVSRKLRDLNELAASVFFPLLLSAVCVETENPRLSELLSLLVSVFVRHNVICGFENSRLENLVFEEARRIRVERSLQATLVQLREFAPTDRAFVDSFKTAEIKRVATARHILRSLEHKLRATEEVVVETPSRVHVEHIYPQAPRPGHKWEEHTSYVHRIGNLTLLGRRMNQQISNGPFSEKRAVYAQSDLKLSQQVGAYEEWSPTRIDERQLQLSGLAAATWPL